MIYDHAEVLSKGLLSHISTLFFPFHTSHCLAIITVSQNSEVIKVQSRGLSSSLVIVFSCLLCLPLFLNFKITA